MSGSASFQRNGTGKASRVNLAVLAKSATVRDHVVLNGRFDPQVPKLTDDASAFSDATPG